MKNILIVDDEDLVRDLLCHAVSLCGHKAYNAANGLEAIEILKRQPNIDIVILDLIMPGISGQETAFHIKNLKPDVEIIISSASISRKDVMEFKKLGINNILQKPYSMTDLQAIISST